MVSTGHSCCSSPAAHGFWPVLCWNLNVDTQKLLTWIAVFEAGFGRKSQREHKRKCLSSCVCYYTLQWLRPLKQSLPAKDQWKFAFWAFFFFFDRQLGFLLKIKMSHKSNRVFLFYISIKNWKMWSSLGPWIQKRVLSCVVPTLSTGNVAPTFTLLACPNLKG